MQREQRAAAIQKAETQQCGTRRVEQENGRQMSVVGWGEEGGKPDGYIHRVTTRLPSDEQRQKRT
jgi:hypothetical protein